VTFWEPEVISKAQEFKADLDEERDIKVPISILLKEALFV